MADTDDGLRRELAEAITTGAGDLGPGWNERAAEACIAGPLAKHTAALEASSDATMRYCERQWDDERGTMLDRIAALQAENARLTDEKARGHRYRDKMKVELTALQADVARLIDGWRWVSEHGKPRTSPDHGGEEWLLTWSENSATYDVACIDGGWGPNQEVSLLGVDAYRWLANFPPPPADLSRDAQEGER